MSRWFRFYDETLNDPKALKLSDKTFRVWVGLLCIASKNDGSLPPFDDMVIMLRTTSGKLQPEVERLIAAELLDHDDNGLRPHNWNTRQYKSDVTDPTNAERQQRYRNGKRNGAVTATQTPIKRPETEADTESETDQRAEKKTRSQSSRGVSLPDGWMPTNEDVAYGIQLGLTPKQIGAASEDMRLWAKANSNRSIGRKADWSATFKGWMRRNIKPGGGNGRAENPNSVVAAQRKHIAEKIQFGPRPSLFPGTTGGSPVRLLPQRGRERPGDVHGGGDGDSGGIPGGGDPVRDRPEDWDSAEKQLVADPSGG